MNHPVQSSRLGPLHSRARESCDHEGVLVLYPRCPAQCLRSPIRHQSQQKVPHGPAYGAEVSSTCQAQDWLWNQAALGVTASTCEGTEKKGRGYTTFSNMNLWKSPHSLPRKGSIKHKR